MFTNDNDYASNGPKKQPQTVDSGCQSDRAVTFADEILRSLFSQLTNDEFIRMAADYRDPAARVRKLLKGGELADFINEHSAAQSILIGAASRRRFSDRKSEPYRLEVASQF